MNESVAFTVTRDGEIKIQSASIKDVVISPLVVSESNIQYRYRIETRTVGERKWADTGVAIEPQEGAESRVVFVADHFSEREPELLVHRTPRGFELAYKSGLSFEITARG